MSGDPSEAIRTNDRVAMTVSVAPTSAALAGRAPGDPVPQTLRRIIGLVRGVDHDRGIAEVYWETGAARVHRLDELAKWRARRIDFAADFTRYPGGRYREEGPWTGQRFLEDVLVPALKGSDVVTIAMDGAAGFGSSFLDGAFGELGRDPGRYGLAGVELSRIITVETRDERLREIIRQLLEKGNWDL